MNKFWLVSCLLLAGRWVAAAQIGPPSLLAHGDDQHMWVAEVAQLSTRPTSFQTLIYYRAEGQSKWQLLSQLPDRVVALASQGSQPAVLLDDGSWILLYPDSAQTADTLPMRYRMVALAGARQTWWAIGVAAGDIDLATQPAASTQPLASAPATAAAASPRSNKNRPAQTQSGVSRLVLFTLSGNQWTKAAEVPDEVSDAPNVSLAIIDDVPYVADLDTSGQLQVRHWADRKWVRDVAPMRLGQVAAFKLLSDATLPRLWLEQPSGPDLLYVLGRPSDPTRLEPITGAAPAARALAVAFGKLRMVASVNGKLLERDYNPSNGAPDGAPFEILLPQPSPLGILPSIQSLIVTVALIVAIFASFRQWPATRGLAERLGQMPIAPLGRRLAAGLIDVAPVVLAVAVLLVRLRTLRDESAALQVLLVYWAAALFYVIYTTVIESLGGRTLGKVALGLRVVGLDGQPAPSAALVTRNVLRVIDVGIFFIPLLLVLFFPLRQRVGDVAAGTLVFYGEVPAPQETSDQANPVPSTRGQDGK